MTPPIPKNLMGVLSEAMKEEPKKEPKVFTTMESKIDFILEELMELKSSQVKLLTEHNFIPKGSTEMFIQINGRIFKGEMELVE